MKHRIVLNATTLVKGGALQACVSFIITSLKIDDDIEWIYFVSSQVAQQLQRFDIDSSDIDAKVFAISPARSRRTRRLLINELDQIKPDAVFTFFGPAYVKMPVPHLLGVADGWVTHSTKLAYQSLNGLGEKFTTLLRCVYKGWWYRFADHWVVEAEAAARGLSRRMRIDASRIHTVSNSCAPHYLESRTGAFDVGTDKTIKLLTLSSYYPHKNLEIIPDVARELKRLRGDDDFAFILTLAQSDELSAILRSAQALGVSENVCNIGPVDVKDGPNLYDSIDIAFVPTLLETFTAAYPEAMAMKTPIVTTDLDFAHDICQDSALYYTANSASDAASKINTVLNDKATSSGIVASGRGVLKSLPSAELRYAAYRELLTGLISRGR